MLSPAQMPSAPTWIYRPYYTLKPYLPWRLRNALRRISIVGKRKKYANVWPINEAASRAPENWKGWPDGKKFALVLTHDVEGADGLAKARQLMALEKRLGFRSSFNFVPEGEAPVPMELLRELKEEGFEIGVHDLNHDGKLFRSHADFKRKAERINHYLREWGAVGFRSGFMFRNLDWLHDVKGQYDASTFDTDPFEPQSDGVNTIFPFWKSDGNGSGYVELPYTLAQDSTIFMLLRETSPRIWMEKLDWVARHGGMALVNVHPDYMHFNSDHGVSRTYPSAFYEELLKYASRRYGNECWQALPSEVATYVETFKPQIPTPRRRVCLVGPLFYESDNRTMRYAEALQQRGDEVDVVCVRRPGTPVKSEMRGVKIHGIRVRERNESGKLAYLWRLGAFTLHAACYIGSLHWRKRYDLIHAHSIPDYVVFSAMVPKLMGTPVILDVYDMTPEFYLAKFNAKSDAFAITLLKWIEKCSCHFADHVISANDIWQKKLVARSIPEDRCSPYVNYIDTRVFSRRARTRKDDRFVVIYPGILNPHQGVDVAIRAFAMFSEKVANAEFHIYGDGPEKAMLIELTQKLKLGGRVQFKESVPLDSIPQLMADADLGVVGKLANVFGNEAYSTKIAEYMSQGIPAVVPRTAIDSHYFTDAEVLFYQPGNSVDMAEKMVIAATDVSVRNRLVENAFRYIEKHNWKNKVPDYLALVERLIRS